LALFVPGDRIALTDGKRHVVLALKVFEYVIVTDHGRRFRHIIRHLDIPAHDSPLKNARSDVVMALEIAIDSTSGPRAEAFWTQRLR
jgi:hypothetical protein